MKISYQSIPALILLIVISFSCQNNTLKIKIESGSDSPQVTYGIEKLKEVAGNGRIIFTPDKADFFIQAFVDTDNLDREAYRIESDNNHVKVSGGDEVGLMYGLLEIKEQLSNGNNTITSKHESPNLSFRAIKFNLPWESYRRGKALQLHYETSRDINFWRDFLDMMAKNRFNKLTLWNHHPFSYMVKTEKYPEACSLSDEELAEWEEFWHSLFKMAKTRGIETYLVNWNIFVSPEFARAHNVAEYSISGEYTVHKGDTSEIIKDYMRESVKEVIDKYPDLTGLGITLGEGMGGMTAVERNDWLLDSFIEGMRMASRKIKFIYRAPLSAGLSSGGSTSAAVERLTRETLDTLSSVEGPINIELKFNWSHSHSTPHLAKVHGGRLTDAYWNPLPENYYLAWTMRNEDFFMLRWGQPEFIRQHINQNTGPHVNGYFIGSETYIPAKDYFTTIEGSSYKYAFERQWMFYKNWGRLLYNPETPDDVFQQAFISRFPENGRELFEAQVKVSRIPLIVASYWNATWDFTLYSEGMMSLVEKDWAMGLIPLVEMAAKTPMDPDYMSIKDFLASGEKDSYSKITPFNLADSINSFCEKALQMIENIQPGKNTDLLYEVSDIRAWAYLGFYFSNKLRASVEYQKFVTNYDASSLVKAVMWLEKSADNWKDLVSVTKAVYEPVPLLHFNYSPQEYFHWSKIEKEVIDELNWLKGLKTND